MPEQVNTPGGRPLTVFGQADLLTAARMADVLAHFDTDPRIASISLVPGSGRSWLRASTPAGPVIVVARDLDDLTAGPTRPVEADEAVALAAWARRASERGLWHDWLVVDADDVAQAPALLDQAECDRIEAADPTSAAYAAARQPGAAGSAKAALTVAVDVTWLGPYQTGAQVLTTAAIEALAARPDVAEVLLFGLDSLPGYAAHLSRVPGVRLIGSPQEPTEHTAPGHVIQQRADIVWYPNQIDHRSNIGAARELGARVVTTYLDLIAYDIPRYHGSAAAWHAYRRLQRRIALSCDGITAISADVANRLLQEVPRLEPERVLALPLGLDHIAVASTPAEPDADLDRVRAGLKGHNFVLVLGNDFQHKNRDLAIRAWQRAMQSGRPEHLVLAGLHVRSSSSQQAEETALAEEPGLRDRVHLVGHVSPASRQWLLAHAMAVMYPSSAEGFGFVPYEAAVLGTASVFGDFGPLKEISGASGLPNGWSVQAHADDLARLLDDPAARAERIAQLQTAIAARTWADFAADLVAFFRHIRELPQAATSVLGSEQTAEAAQLNAILSSRAYRATQRLKRALGR